MIRDDPDSRARLRVTPEQALNFPNYYCLASWIANGTRVPSFMGQTYPLPDAGDEWADKHLAAQDERVGPYPEQLESTLGTSAAPESEEPARPSSSGTAITPAVDAPERGRPRLARAESRGQRPASRRSTRSRSTTSLHPRRPPTLPTVRSAGSSDVA
jgi:hypothetical protein